MICTKMLEKLKNPNKYGQGSKSREHTTARILKRVRRIRDSFCLMNSFVFQLYHWLSDLYNTSLSEHAPRQMVKAQCAVCIVRECGEFEWNFDTRRNSRVAKPMALRAQSSASKIDDVKFLSRCRATECNLFKRIMYYAQQSIKTLNK